MKREILKNSFYQLLVVYTLLIVLASFGLFSEFTIHFEIFAVLLGVIGYFIIENLPEKKINKKIHIALIVLAILLIFIFRAIPYTSNNIPIGYDSGLYKYAIDYGLERSDNWISKGVEPGFLYLMEPLKLFFSSDFLISWVFIFFNIILGISIYFFSKEYFGSKAAVISLLIYSVSVVQFLTFTYLYYKNIIALSLMLFAFYFLKKRANYSIPTFIILGILIGIIHRPTFYIFGLSYFIFAFLSPIKDKSYDLKVLKNNIVSGLLILVISSLFYLGRFKPAITNLIAPVIRGFSSPGLSPGTFISFSQYQFLTLTYLPFAILGFVYLIKNKKFNILFIWTLINSLIVYFQFFFFNRFIIHLDIALIILSGFGFSILIEKKKIFSTCVLALMLISSGFLTYQESINTKTLITETDFKLINSLSNNTEKNSYIISISSEYSPWILAYSNRTVIAPGLFDENLWTETQWNTFWKSSDAQETSNLLSFYNTSRPIYLYSSTKTFKNPCFNVLLEEEEHKLLKYTC